MEEGKWELLDFVEGVREVEVEGKFTFAREGGNLANCFRFREDCDRGRLEELGLGFKYLNRWVGIDTMMGKGIWISKCGKNNFVLLDFQGLEAFYREYDEIRIYDVRESGAGVESDAWFADRVFWAKTWGELLYLRWNNLPVLYSSAATIKGIKRALRGKILVDIQTDEGLCVSDLSGVNYELAIMPGYSSIMEILIENGNNRKLLYESMRDGIEAGFRHDTAIAEADDKVIDISSRAGGYYVSIPKNEELGWKADNYQLTDFLLFPIEEYRSDEGRFWSFLCKNKNGDIVNVSINVNEDFKTPESFRQKAISFGGFYNANRRGGAIRNVVLDALIAYLGNRFKKNKRPVKKLGYDLTTNTFVMPRWKNSASNIYAVSAFGERSELKSAALAPNLWGIQAKEPDEHFREVLAAAFSTWGFRPDSSNYVYEALAAPATFAWAIASYYAPFFYRDLKTFPILALHGTPGSGKTYLFHFLLQALRYSEGDVLIPISGNSTPAGISRVVDMIRSGFVIFDEFTNANIAKKGELYQQVTQIIRNAYDGGSRVVADREHQTETIKRTYRCPIATGAEVAMEDLATRERSLLISMKKYSELPTYMTKVDPMTLANDLNPYMKYFLSQVNEYSWQLLFKQIKIASDFIRKKVPSATKRIANNWAVVLVFAKSFFTPAQYEQYVLQILSTLGASAKDNVTDNFLMTLEAALGYIRYTKINFDKNLYGPSMKCYKNLFCFRWDDVINYAHLYKNLMRSDMAIVSTFEKRSIVRSRKYFVLFDAQEGGGRKVVRTERVIAVGGKKTRCVAIDLNLLSSSLRSFIEELDMELVSHEPELGSEEDFEKWSED